MTFKEMADELWRHKYRYYILYTPTISDYAYDMLEQELKKIDPENPVLHVVGPEIASGYPEHIQREFLEGQ